MNEFLKYLENQMSILTEVYSQAADETKKILEKVYGEEEIAFPINIERVAEHYGIQIESVQLNRDAEKRFSRLLGQLRVSDGSSKIIVDNSVSYKTRRYAIAHAIARYCLMDNNQESDIFEIESTYAIPLVPQNFDDIVLDVIALFFLLPVDIFQKEFSDYLGRVTTYPMDVDQWLEYLSDKSMVSMFNLSIGYQQLKQVLSFKRQKAFAECGYDIEAMPKMPYDNIYA